MQCIKINKLRIFACEKQRKISTIIVSQWQHYVSIRILFELIDLQKTRSFLYEQYMRFDRNNVPEDERNNNVHLQLNDQIENQYPNILNFILFIVQFVV